MSPDIRERRRFADRMRDVRPWNLDSNRTNPSSAACEVCDGRRILRCVRCGEGEHRDHLVTCPTCTGGES